MDVKLAALVDGASVIATGCKCQNCQNLPPEASSRASQMSSPEIIVEMKMKVTAMVDL